MRLDVYQEAAPIIRLLEFDQGDLRQLRETLADMVEGRRTVVPLHEEPYIQPAEGCRFTLRCGDDDEGIRHAVEPNLFGWVAVPGTWVPFACTLTRSGWARVMAGVDLLLHLRFLCSEYVWLHKQWQGHTDAAWLLSPDGEW